jgi:hypothetical protein
VRDLGLKLDAAREELLHIILPDLSDEAIKRAVSLTGYVPLRNEDPRGGVEKERTQLTARIAEIEAQTAYSQRELLRAPRVGVLTRQVAELEDFSKTLTETMWAANHPRLQRLIESGYDTDSYATGWWRSSYYADWKAGDEILARFPNKKRFAEVREEVVQARDSLEVYNAKLDELRKQIAAGEALEQEHDDLAARLAGLDEKHLGDWRKRLGDYLTDLGPTALADRLEREPELLLLTKRMSGLKHQIDYLDQIAGQVETMRQALLEERSKVGRERYKWSRPKHAWMTFDPEASDKRFRLRPAKMRQRRERFWATYDTVSGFDRYDRARLVEDFLWWDLMTDGRIDGDFIPEVRAFHTHHPDYRYDRIDRDLFDDRADAAAAAAAAIEADRSRDTDQTVGMDAS